MIILADSGKLKMTDDKQHLFLTLYNGESFENLRDQRTSVSNIPYRRETFSLKEIMIAFDANFNRMDDGIMQNQYIGKDLTALQSVNRLDDLSGGTVSAVTMPAVCRHRAISRCMKARVSESRPMTLSGKNRR